MPTPEITADDARHVLWSVGDARGYQPGSFTETLLAAIRKADPANRARLFLGFPGLVQAVMLSATRSGCDELARIAEAGS